MSTINEEIKKLKNEIFALKSKVADLTRNTQSKSIPPYSKVKTAKGQGWWFIEGKWCTYAIYAD